MAIAAPRYTEPKPYNMSNIGYRAHPDERSASYGTIYASPTDSEFSEGFNDHDDVRRWDERRVAEWLQSINAGQYTKIFQENNITGENLMDMDQTVLKEIGVSRVGDRVRIGSQAKQFRAKEYRRKQIIRESMAGQENTPPSSASPRPPRSTNSQPTPVQEKRMSRIPLGAENGLGLRDAKAVKIVSSGNGSRPASPMYSDQDWRNGRKKHTASSPRDAQPMREKNEAYYRGGSRENLAIKTARATAETPRTAQFKTPVSADMPRGLNIQTNTRNHNGLLPPNSTQVKIVHESGGISVCDVDGIRSAEEMIARIHKQARLSEPSKNYQFYVMIGTEPNYAMCQPLTNADLLAIGTDITRPERQRLIIRKISYGEPEGAQLVKASEIAKEQMRANISPNLSRSKTKIEKLTGEALPATSFPMSPASVALHEEHLNSTAQDLEGSDSLEPPPRRPRKADSFTGERPESQYIMNDPSIFFPTNKEEVNKALRMSIRRSKRLSRANTRVSQNSRLSTASNFSIGSNSTADVPAVPAIPAGFANGETTPVRPRPLSILRLGRSSSQIRDSMASSTLDPLDEESSYEPNRKSYVSFGDSNPGSATASISEHDTKTAINIGSDPSTSYYEDGGSSPVTENGSSLGEQIKEAIETDGEEPDEELNDFLTGANNSWDNISYIKGKLIGQGSFGSVYMALHTVTAELMAVKQVELPSTAGTAIDAKKNHMIEALKREIALLRELRHPNIVQYLGSSSDGNNLNIFLEYVPGGSIAKMLVDYGALPEEMAARLTRQILVGLAYLHSKDIIHRDIKGANILVDSHGFVKISDFGISKRVQDSKNALAEPTATAAAGAGTRGARAGVGMPGNRVSMQGSVFWMAPEVVKQTAYTRKADIWSLGCLVVEMLTGSHPHPNLSQLQAIFKIGGKGNLSDPSPDIPQKSSKEVKEFLIKTFKVEHTERPEAQELLQMKFIKDSNGA